MLDDPQRVEAVLRAADLFHCGGLPGAEVARELATGFAARSWSYRVVERSVLRAESVATAVSGAGENRLFDGLHGQRAMRLEGRTTFVIAHRLSTIQRADIDRGSEE